MTAENSPTETLLRQANMDGIQTFLDGHGKLRIRGDAGARQRWKTTLQKHKDQIIKFLKLEITASAPAANVIPMTQNEHSLILEWLSHIGEHDPVNINHVVASCQSQLLDRDYFLRRVWTDLPQPDVEIDDRIRCRQCNNLHGAQCDAVPIGTLPRITKHFKPDPTVLRRCAWFETIPIPDWDINQPGTKES